MNNVHTFVPKLTVNRSFMYGFVDADAPCFALGLVEERKLQCGLLALRPGEPIPPAVSSAGFSFGHSLFGNDDFEVIHFAFQFYGFRTYNVLLNPSNPIVQVVARRMVETGEYFFFALSPEQSVTAFRTEIGKQDLVGLKLHFRRILDSSTTDAQYQRALTQFRQSLAPTDRLLNWVGRDNRACLDLTHDRLELSPSAETHATPPPGGPANSKPEPICHPLSMLPTIAMLIDGELESAEELRTSLSAARKRPYLLDDDTVQRVFRLHGDQLAFVPIHRAQLARWCADSPAPAQRAEIERLSKQLDRHEDVLAALVALARELESGTAEAIARMDEGELGLAVFDGTLSPPDGAPVSEGLRLQEQHAIAKVLDAYLEDLEENGFNDLDILGQMAPQMPLLKRLMEISNEGEMADLCDEFFALDRFVGQLERLAEGIRSGAIAVPG